MDRRNWICCQIGAREHYAVPRALHRRGVLELLLTDVWVPPDHPLTTIKPNLGQRFHSELENARVVSANLRSVAFELQNRITGRRGWAGVIGRNKWFQEWAAKQLQHIPHDGLPRTLFAYSYAARDLFQLARTRGWRTVLGQIDPGLHEERLVQKLYSEVDDENHAWKPAPPQYWHDWREECDLSDYIVVNSEWSRQGLLAEGIPEEKMQIVPLAFEAETRENTDTNIGREYPREFTRARALRVLFLGQVNLRKGIRPLFEAVRCLRDKPIEFWFVGPLQTLVPEDLRKNANVHWLGPVPRNEVSKYYREADLFILPTLSDGFALTQLEAMAYRLPVIASRFCGSVVQDGIDGIILNEVTPEAICQALCLFLDHPEQLRSFSSACKIQPEFSLSALSERLVTTLESTATQPFASNE